MAIKSLSYGRHGLRDWLFQRISAVIIAAYTFFLLGYWLMHPGFDYGMWVSLFAHPAMAIFSFLCLLALAIHAWIGIWIVATDYLKVAVLRYVVLIIVALTLIVCLLWGIQILWGVSV